MDSDIFSNNPVADLFGISYPVNQAGMVWCSGWQLAAAVSNAGGLGLIGSGSMCPDTLRENIRNCRQATDRPFGVNVPLLYKHSEQNLEVVVEEGVKIVFTSGGSPKHTTPMLKRHGITVVHVVPSARLAKKSEDAGADAVVAAGFEGGGHHGREETTSMCLIPLVKKAVSIPVIAAGGIASGRAMLAAMALGADGVQIGTRFVASEESSAHIDFKKRVIAAGEGDTILTLKQLTPVRMLKNRFYEEVREYEMRGEPKERLEALLGKGRSKKGMSEGDLDQGELEIGQVCAGIREIKPAGEIVRDIVAEFSAAALEIARLARNLP